MNRITAIAKFQDHAEQDVLIRLEKLEGVFLAGLQDIRIIKSELKKGTNGNTGLEKLLDAKVVAELLGETEKWVYRQAKAHLLPSIKIGKYWKFSPSALQKWLVERQTP